MMLNKVITINKKGMITIPSEIRKKYGFHDGSQIVILDIEGRLEIMPIVDDFAEIQKILPSREEMMRTYEESREDEIKLENSK